MARSSHSIRTLLPFLRHVQLLLLLHVAVATAVNAQNVGIGTSSPLRKLSVTGSLMVDQNNNNMGTLDSAALVFGSAGVSGISSRKTVGGDQHNLVFWAGGTPYMNLSPTGNLGIGGNYSPTLRLWVRNGNTWLEGNAEVAGTLEVQQNTAVGGAVDPLYRLRVYGGNARVGGDFHATGNAAFGGEVDPDYRLRVIGGNSRFGGDMHATGNMGVGGLPDNTHRLRVYNGSSFFDGSLQVTGHTTVNSLGSTGNISTNATITAGNVNVNNSLTIDGKGSVRSNGPSPLRIGFDERPVNVFLVANSATTVTANITDFTGDNDDVRVMVSQIAFGAGNTMFSENLIVHVVSVDAAANTCNLRIVNRGNVAVTLVATIYLTTIAKS